jgi:type IV secretory pathway TraG/TraD family ATPase VirD4
MFRLLTDAPFRRKLLAHVSDPFVLPVFAPLDQMRPRDVENHVGSTLRRIFQLCYPFVSRRSLGATHNAIDFRTIMDEGKAVLVNLGSIHAAVPRKLLGALIMVQLEHAARSRETLPKKERRPFTFLVDEWSDFASQGETLSNLLAQARKYGLSLYLCGQDFSQVNDQSVHGAVGNCNVSVSFGLDRPTAEIQAASIGRFDPQLFRGVMVNEEAQPVYASPTDQRELLTSDLQNLPKRHALLKIANNDPVRFRTLTLKTPRVNDQEFDQLVNEFRRRYSIFSSGGGSPFESGQDGRIDDVDKYLNDEYNDALDHPETPGDPEDWDINEEG